MSYERISLKGMSRQEWLMLRKKGIGGSDAAAAVGWNPYRSALNVYRDKTTDEVEEVSSEALRIGSDLENYVAFRFMEREGKKVMKVGYLYKHDTYKYLIADIDRKVCGEDAFLEIKTTSPYNKDQWKQGIPLVYLCQIYHYMYVTGMKKAYICALILGEDLIIREVNWDEEKISTLIAKERDFWENFVMKGIMPPADGSKSCDEVIGKYYPRSEVGSVVTLKGFDESLSRRAKLQEEIDTLEKEKNQIDQIIKLALGDSQFGLTENYKISWSNVVSTRLDTKRLQSERPEIFDEYSKTSTSRRFQIKVA